jgi:hypothetical protein
MVGPYPAFKSVVTDLFGPIAFVGIINKMQTFVYCLFCNPQGVCRNSTDSFLMALYRFVFLRGTLSRMQSDRGEQLVAASQQLQAWDFNSILKWAGKRGIKWHQVLTGRLLG